MDAKTIAKLIAQLDLPRPEKDLSNNMVPNERYMTCEIEGVGEVVVILHEFGVVVDFWPCKNSPAKLKGATRIGWLSYNDAGVYVLDESHNEWATYPPREERE